jgi:hypothetical protein
MQIGLITEGITDRPIINATLYAYFSQKKMENGFTTTFLIPEGKESAGWTKVLKYCSTDRFKGAFTLNDYVIIQIDADAHLSKGFDVPKQKTTTDLINAIKTRIIEAIGIDFYTLYQSRIIFAICVDQIECWLLPFFATTAAHKKKEVNCCATVNLYLRKKGFTLDCTNDADGYNEYQKAARFIADRKVFFSIYKNNPSLQYFVEKELSKIQIVQVL